MSDLSRIEAWQDEPCPHDEQRKFCCAECLLDLVDTERAAATAAAVGACVKAIDYTAPGVDPATHEEAIEIDTVRACVASIRALSPEGWVGVRRDTLLTWSERIRTAERSFGSLLDLTLLRDVVADIDRAALARGEGESDG